MENYSSKKSVEEPPIVSLSEFYKSLKGEYKVIFDGLNIESEKFRLYFTILCQILSLCGQLKKVEDFVGCTGDDSFSKVISMGKVPLYYAIETQINF